MLQAEMQQVIESFNPKMDWDQKWYWEGGHCDSLTIQYLDDAMKFEAVYESEYGATEVKDFYLGEDKELGEFIKQKMFTV